MSNYNDIRNALGASIQAFNPALNPYFYVPRTFVPPAAIIKPHPHRTISYMAAQSSSLAEWYFTVMLVVGEVDEQAAQQQAGDLISPGSALIEALNNTTLPATGWAKVAEGAVSQMQVTDSVGGAALYTYAQLSVVVTG